MLNTIAFAGNLATDPELRFTPSGKPVGDVRVIVNRRTKTASGDYEDAEPTGHSCTIWGPEAENVAESLRKGDRVLVVGHIETQTWNDRETNDKRTRDVVIVEEIGTSLKYSTATPVKNPKRTTTDDTTGESNGQD